MSYMTPRSIGSASRSLASFQASSSKRTLSSWTIVEKRNVASSSTSARKEDRSMSTSRAAAAPSIAGIDRSTPTDAHSTQHLPFPNLEFPSAGSRRSIPTTEPHPSSASPSASTLHDPSSSPALRGRLADILRSSLDNLAPSRQRAFKGVHSRADRAKGTTPQEAKALNQVIAGLYKDLERFGGPLQSSNPITDPFGHTFASTPRKDTSVAQLRTLFRKREDGMSETEAAEMRAQVTELREDMSSVLSESDLIRWAERRVFAPIASGEDSPTYSRTYPHVLGHLMSTTRDSFKNPSLALAFFQHAQTLSLESYISGCLTPAYNQLLKTRWRSFNDLEGVSQGIKEMETNGVAWDAGTQKVVGAICESLSASGIMGGGDSQWKDYIMARWRALEGKAQMGPARDEGWNRMAEAQRMARGIDRDTKAAQARFGTDSRAVGHGPRHQGPGAVSSPQHHGRSHRPPRRDDNEDPRWSRGWDGQVEEEPQRAFA